MRVRDPTFWMWSEALELLERADRLHRQFCQLAPTSHDYPTWEPPVDMFETEGQFVVVVALPGVSADQLSVEFNVGTIIVRGVRRQPALAGRGRIHQMELPYGHFERRIDLPNLQLQLDQHILADGCLTLTLNKLGIKG